MSPCVSVSGSRGSIVFFVCASWKWWYGEVLLFEGSFSFEGRWRRTCEMRVLFSCLSTPAVAQRCCEVGLTEMRISSFRLASGFWRNKIILRNISTGIRYSFWRGKWMSFTFMCAKMKLRKQLRKLKVPFPFFFLRSKVELCHFGADEWKRRILALSASYRSVQGSCSQKRQKTA